MASPVDAAPAEPAAAASNPATPTLYDAGHGGVFAIRPGEAVAGPALGALTLRTRPQRETILGCRGRSSPHKTG